MPKGRGTYSSKRGRPSKKSKSMKSKKAKFGKKK